MLLPHTNAKKRKRNVQKPNIDNKTVLIKG